MKIARWMDGDTASEGFVQGDRLVPFPGGATVADVLRDGLDAAAALGASADPSTGAALARARLLAPLAPSSIRDFTAFEEHVEGMSADAEGVSHVPDAWYEFPTFYFTNPNVVYGSGASIRPPNTERLDYELEVAAVLGGAPGEDLDPETADRHIFGYTIFNDWSARDLQLIDMRMRLGPAKGKDFANSLGPWIVTRDEVDDRIDDDGFLHLEAEVSVNGTVTGRDLVSNMSWTFPELISYASRASVVSAGDVIGSGTAGNGGCLAELWGRAGGLLSPPPLVEGDEVVMRVERLGELRGIVGPVRTEPAAIPGGRRRAKPRPRSR